MEGNCSVECFWCASGFCRPAGTGIHESNKRFTLGQPGPCEREDPTREGGADFRRDNLCWWLPYVVAHRQWRYQITTRLVHDCEPDEFAGYGRWSSFTRADGQQLRWVGQKPGRG